MEKVTVQINTKGEYWEDVPKVNHTFKTWKEVSTFAYRLTLHFNCEVRVESKGQGHYYNTNNALNFLSV
jgi:hypothetical protein